MRFGVWTGNPLNVDRPMGGGGSDSAALTTRKPILRLQLTPE